MARVNRTAVHDLCVDGANRLAKFTPAWTPYKADAKKLKEEFRDVRKPLSLAMDRARTAPTGFACR